MKEVNQKETESFKRETAMLNILTRKELETYLQISDVTIYNWEQRGWLKPISLGRKVYYKIKDINNLLEKGYTTKDVA